MTSKSKPIAGRHSAPVYKALKSIGLTSRQVGFLLPGWWSPEIELSKSGALEMAMYISRRLRLDLDELVSGRATSLDAENRVSYKHSASVQKSSLTTATRMARALAHTVLAGRRKSGPDLPLSAERMRALAIEASPKACVDLDSILSICWQLEIPVIPLLRLPNGVRKMDGAAMNIQGRPVIVVSKATESKAWLSFIIAHELGHIALGHLHDDEVIVDDRLQAGSEMSTGEGDDQEVQATLWGLALLGGPQVLEEVSSWPDHLIASELALKSYQLEKTHSVAAGHVALRYAFQHQRFPEAQNALRYMPEDKHGLASVQNALREELSSQWLAEDAQDFILRMTEIEVAS